MYVIIVVSAASGLWPAIRIGSEWPGLLDNIEQGLLVGFVPAEAWSIRASTYDAEHECHRAMHQHLRRRSQTQLGVARSRNHFSELVTPSTVGLNHVGAALGALANADMIIRAPGVADRALAVLQEWLDIAGQPWQLVKLAPRFAMQVMRGGCPT